MRVQKRSDILFIFYKAMTKIVARFWKRDCDVRTGVNLYKKDEGVMELPPLLCVYTFFFLFHFFLPFWNFFVKGAPKLLHVERFVVDDVFFIFRDIYKSVYRKHTTTTAERKKKTSFVPYLEVVL